MTSVTTSSSKAAQLTALDQSGWGLPFRFFQPHNPAFWVYLWGIGAGAVSLVQVFGPASKTYDVALTTGIVLFGIYLVPWLLFLKHQNRYTAQPGGLLATGFAWGGLAAAFWISLPANDAMLSLWSKAFGAAWASDWAAGLTAPIDEEFSKALGLILLISLAPRLIRSAYDGFIIGAYIGLGFQIVEDVLYAYQGAASQYGNDQFGSALFTFGVRGASGLVSHALFSSIFCAGVMWILGRTPGERKIVRGVLAILTAMVFHFAWDDAGALSGGTALAALLPFLIAIVEILSVGVVLRLAATQERAWTRDLLTPEVENGVLDEELLTAASGVRKDRKRYRKAIRSRRRSRHLLAATADLAREIANAHGADTRRVDHARAELLRLRS
jgi:RsiW-degrading membrane proteinase PrsW (M82 family)